MTTHTGPTGQATRVTLPSALERVLWAVRVAPAGGTAGLEVLTRYVGNGATLKIQLVDHRGRTLGQAEGRIAANRYRGDIAIPENAEGGLTAKVSLPDHGLKMDSEMLAVHVGPTVTNAKWSADEARRGDMLTLTADVTNASDGTGAQITILEHDADSAHDLITQIATLVEGGKVETTWEYEYHEDTDAIPTDEELEKGYNPPEYFFRVSVLGRSAESGLLTFKDWLDIRLVDEAGEPIADQEYILHFSDGSQRRGTLDAGGRVQENDVPPGPYQIEYPGCEVEAEDAGPIFESDETED